MSTIASTQSTTSPVMLPGTPTASPAASPEIYRFSVNQYERMGDAGILTEDDRVELVEGLIYRKPMKNGPHSISCRRTAAALTRDRPGRSLLRHPGGSGRASRAVLACRSPTSPS